MTRPNSGAARFFDAARAFDLAMAPLERAFLRHPRRWIGERARGTVLLVGIGTGADLPYLAQDVTITGLDLAPDMLEGARRRAAAECRDVELVVGDAGDLPFAAASFDTVICTFALCGVPDEKLALAEMVRVLRPGGDLLLADHVESNLAPVQALQRALDALTQRRGEHWRRRPLLHLEGLGLEVVDTYRDTLGVLERVHARLRTA